MDELTRIRICGLVAGILSSDGEIREEEAAFLQRMRARFALPKGTALDPANDRDEALRELAALPEDVRQRAFLLLVDAAAADGEVTAPELELLQSFSAALGVTEDLDARIEAAIASRKPQPFGLAEKQKDDI